MNFNDHRKKFFDTYGKDIAEYVASNEPIEATRYNRILSIIEEAFYTGYQMGEHELLNFYESYIEKHNIKKTLCYGCMLRAKYPFDIKEASK